MEKFELLFECYISGQLSEKQWQDHLKYDKGLKEWYKDFLDEKRKRWHEKFQELSTSK